MTLNPPASSNDLYTHVLNAIAAFWMRTHPITDGLMADTLEQFIVKLKLSDYCHEPAIASFLNLDEDYVWKQMSGRMGGREEPWGVLNFSATFFDTARMRLDSLSKQFPRMVQAIEKILPTVP